MGLFSRKNKETKNEVKEEQKAVNTAGDRDGDHDDATIKSLGSAFVDDSLAKDPINLSDKDTKKLKKGEYVDLWFVVPKKWTDNNSKTISFNVDSYNASRFESRPLTICDSYEKASEWCEQYFFLRHFSHIQSWAPLHGHENPFAYDTWMDYCDVVLNHDEEANGESEDALMICSVKFTADRVGAMLRTALMCPAVGLEWEDMETWKDMIAYSSKDNPIPDAYLEVLKGLGEVFEAKGSADAAQIVENMLEIHTTKQKLDEDGSDFSDVEAFVEAIEKILKDENKNKNSSSNKDDDSELIQ